MDCHQYKTGEGPCLAAAAEDWFHIESLPNETRWPTFVPPRSMRASRASCRHLSSSLTDRWAAQHLLKHGWGLRCQQQELAALFATEASGILANVGADIADNQLTRRIDVALQERELIAHAEGVLMAREHISAEDDTAALHRSSCAATSPVLQLAAELVASAIAARGPEAIGSSSG